MFHCQNYSQWRKRLQSQTIPGGKVRVSLYYTLVLLVCSLTENPALVFINVNILVTSGTETQKLNTNTIHQHSQHQQNDQMQKKLTTDRAVIPSERDSYQRTTPPSQSGTESSSAAVSLSWIFMLRRALVLSWAWMTCLLFHNKIPVCSTCGKKMTKRDVIIEGLSEIDTGYTAVGSAKRMQFQGK